MAAQSNVREGPHPTDPAYNFGLIRRLMAEITWRTCDQDSFACYESVADSKRKRDF